MVAITSRRDVSIRHGRYTHSRYESSISLGTSNYDGARHMTRSLLPQERM